MSPRHLPLPALTSRSPAWYFLFVICGRVTSAELLAALAVCGPSVFWSNGKQVSLLPLTQLYLCSVHKHNRLETTEVCSYVLARCSSFPYCCCLLLSVQPLLCELSHPAAQRELRGCVYLENEHCVLLVLNTTDRLKHISPTNIIRKMNCHA